MLAVNKKSDKKKTIAIPVAILLLVLLVVLGIYGYQKYFTKSEASTVSRGINDVDYGPPTENDSKGIENNAKQTSESEASKQNEQAPSSTSSIKMSTLSQDATTKTVYVRALVTGMNTGTCRLTASGPNGQKIQKTASASAQASYVICQGFNIPVDEFPTSGKWSFNVDLFKESTTDSISTDTKTLEVKI